MDPIPARLDDADRRWVDGGEGGRADPRRRQRRDGLHEELNGTVKRLDKIIIEQLKRNYYQAGWAWPEKTAGRTGSGRSS